MTADFYVYEHRRKDTGRPFYVGKGKDRRLRVEQSRTAHWRNVVAKAGGYEAVVVARGLDEELAFLAESELISKHRLLGIRIVNLTDGGGGMAGFVCDPDSVARRAAKQRGQHRPHVAAKLRGQTKSEEHRRKLAASKRGQVASAETRAKMSATRKGMPFKLMTCPHCERSMHIACAARWHMGNCKEFR